MPHSASVPARDTERDDAGAAKSARKPLPDHLARETVTHNPEHSCCPECGGGLRHFGEDVSEQLEYVPDSFRVIRHVRPKFACGKCETVVEHLLPHGRSHADWLVPGCWPMSWYRNCRPLPLVSPVRDLCAATC